MAALVATFVAVTMAACAPPRQGGTITVAPGAAARLSLALRFGHAGVGRPDEPASVRVLARRSDLPESVDARAGDVLLTNGAVSFVVAAADGTTRAGALIDGWSRHAPTDGLGALRVVVGDRPVRAIAVRGGTDAPTGAAWVDVVGAVDTPDGPVEVTTRYDVAPGMEGVLVHTTFTPPSWAHEGLAVGDVLEESDEAAVSVAPSPVPALVVGAPAIGYALVAVDTPGAIADGDHRRHGLGASSLVTSPEGPVVYSRFVAVLRRPDRAAVATVQARATGRGVGEIELSVVEERGLPRATERGTRVVLVDEDEPARPLELVVPRSLQPGEPLLAELPVGRWLVRAAGAPRADAARVAIVAGGLSRARVRIRTVAADPAPLPVPASLPVDGPVPDPALEPTPRP